LIKYDTKHLLGSWTVQVGQGVAYISFKFCKPNTSALLNFDTMSFTM